MTQFLVEACWVSSHLSCGSRLQHSLEGLTASTLTGRSSFRCPLSPIACPPQVTPKWLSSCSAMTSLQLETIGELVFVPLGFCLPTKCRQKLKNVVSFTELSIVSANKCMHTADSKCAARVDLNSR